MVAWFPRQGKAAVYEFQGYLEPRRIALMVRRRAPVNVMRISTRNGARRLETI
jgi:hypothetical protein